MQRSAPFCKEGFSKFEASIAPPLVAPAPITATGKSALALDAVINQKGRDVLCVYVLIGQRRSSVLGTIETLRATGALDPERVTALLQPSSSPVEEHEKP